MLVFSSRESQSATGKYLQDSLHCLSVFFSSVCKCPILLSSFLLEETEERERERVFDARVEVGIAAGHVAGFFVRAGLIR